MSMRESVHSRKEMQAMEYLKQISQSPWLAENRQSNLTLHRSVTLPKAKVLTRRNRPMTQQHKMQKTSVMFFNQTRQPVYQNLIMNPCRNSANYNYINYHEPHSMSLLSCKQENRPLQSSARRTCRRKGNNYSDLRKSYQRDFFIRAEGLRSGNDKEIHTNRMAKSPKKGKLWVGRPVIILNTRVPQS